MWVAGSLAVALEHHAAISLLINNQLTGSAFALLRPMVATVVRAYWISAVASDEEVEQARQDDKKAFPPIVEMSAAVGKACGADELFRPFVSAWDAMCSYTHSGARQIANRFTGTDIKPQYSEGAIIQALNSTNMALLFLAAMFFLSTGHQPETDEARRMLLDYTSQFGNRLRSDHNDATDHA